MLRRFLFWAGFIAFCSISGAAYSRPGDVLVALIDGAPLFSDASEASEVLWRFQQGDRLLEWRRENTFVRVASTRKLRWGWVRVDDVTKLILQPVTDFDETLKLLASASEPSSQELPFTLDIDGTPTIEFKGYCNLVDDEKRNRVRPMNETTPAHYAITAQAITCRIRKSADAPGRLQVTLYNGQDVVARAHTVAPFDWVTVRSEGSWGAAHAEHGPSARVFPHSFTQHQRGPGSDPEPVVAKNPAVPKGVYLPPPISGSGFIWPVRGAVISRFGIKTKNLGNDGINIAAKKGTQIRAAENGVVVYASNEITGFGNILLIKHAGEWVTVYAHTERLLVEPGDRVRKGQIIARVGTSGGITRPQLHFEMRKGTNAVDPIIHLKKGPI